MAQSSGVIRCGKKIGTRVPMRRNSMCGIARNRLKDLSSLSSLKIRASPPLKKHVAHFRVYLEITERLFKIRVQFLFANAADDATRVCSSGNNSRNGRSPETARDRDTDAPDPAPACANLRRTGSAMS